MHYLPPDTYALIEQSMPITCVDFVLERQDDNGRREVGLILRNSPHGQVWCHLGGRIGRGETIREALLRHANDTLGVSLELDRDPQPRYVYQWFPPELSPTGTPGGLDFGDDPRKHAVGLSYVVTTVDVPEPKHEALDFGWFAPDALPQPLWPGCEALFARLIS